MPIFWLRMATPYAQMRLALPESPALLLSGAIAALSITLVAKSWRKFGGDPLASGALALAATAVASPYLFNYDLPFLILPILWLVAQGQAHGFRDYEKLMLVAAYLAPFASRAAAFPLGVNLMPAASALVMAMIWTRGCNLSRPANGLPRTAAP